MSQPNTKAPVRLPMEGETPDQILRLPQVVALMNLSRTEIYRRIKDGRFPAPIKLGKHASGWRWGVVKEHLAQLGSPRVRAEAQRDGAS